MMHHHSGTRATTLVSLVEEMDKLLTSEESAPPSRCMLLSWLSFFIIVNSGSLRSLLLKVLVSHRDQFRALGIWSIIH